jgi:hypothetical protein
MAAPKQGTVGIAPAVARWAVLGWQQQQGRLPVYWRTLLDRDPWLKDVVMVIEMVFGGRLGGATVVRIATEPVTSSSTLTGNVLDAIPALIEEPALDQTYQLGVGSSAARSLALSLDPRLIDPPALVLAGLPLAGVAEVALEPREGSNHDRRWVLLRGDIDGSVRFGASDGLDRELMELEIVDPRASCETKLPPWVVDAERFTTGIHDSAVGARVPLVVNGFTAIPAVRTTSVAIGGNDFLFAHGYGWTVSLTSGVQVNGVTVLNTDPVYAWSLVETPDAYGEPVSLIRFSVGGTTWEDSDAVHVTPSRTGGRGVIETLRHIVEDHTALGIDGANAVLFAEAAARFPLRAEPQVLVNGATGASATTALEWIEGGYLAALPMLSMVWEGGRYGPVLTDHRLEPIAQWEAGALPLLDRVSLVEETAKADLRNEFVLSYDYDPVEDIYRKVLVRGAANSDVCRYSMEMFGARHADPIEAPYYADDSLAEYVLDWLVEHQALPSYLVQYDAAPSVALTHRRGDTIALTDSDFGWVRQPATIQGITYQRSRAQVMLRVWVRYMDLGGQSLSV